MHIELSGKPIPIGATVTVDHVVQEYTIKDFLQRKWEVLKAEQTFHDAYVRVVQ